MVVAGTPLDFRLGFGRFGDARVVHLADTAAGVSPNIELAGSVAGDLAATFAALAEHAPRSAVHQDWVQELRDDETKRRAAEQDRLESAASPIDPARVYGELRKRLARDTIVIGDGGDFVSYTGKYVDTFVPGCFLGPGPFGCLGSGTGYALAAACAGEGPLEGDDGGGSTTPAPEALAISSALPERTSWPAARPGAKAARAASRGPGRARRRAESARAQPRKIAAKARIGVIL